MSAEEIRNSAQVPNHIINLSINTTCATGGFKETGHVFKIVFLRNRTGLSSSNLSSASLRSR